MIVLDASLLANVVGDDGADGDLAREFVASEPDVALPDLADVETASVLRRWWLADDLDLRRFAAAIEDLAALPFPRYPALPFLRRAYELRQNLTAYDAVYRARRSSRVHPRDGGPAPNPRAWNRLHDSMDRSAAEDLARFSHQVA